MDGGRRGSGRRGASRADKAKERLSNLLAIRKGQSGAAGDGSDGEGGDGRGPGDEARQQYGARAKTFQVAEEAAIFDVVDDVQYAAVVAERRNKYGDFVVDDGGAGYVDIGEEDDWNQSYYRGDDADRRDAGRGQKRGRGAAAVAGGQENADGRSAKRKGKSDTHEEREACGRKALP